jgi:hypothetical protein
MHRHKMPRRAHSAQQPRQQNAARGLSVLTSSLHPQRRLRHRERSLRSPLGAALPWSSSPGRAPFAYGLSFPRADGLLICLPLWSP